MSFRHLLSPILRRFCSSDNPELTSSSGQPRAEVGAASRTTSAALKSPKSRKLARDQEFADSPGSILAEIGTKHVGIDEAADHIALMPVEDARPEERSSAHSSSGLDRALRESPQYVSHLTKEGIMENQENLEPPTTEGVRPRSPSLATSSQSRAASQRVKSASASPPPQTRTGFQRRSDRSIRHVESSPPLHSIALANRMRNRQTNGDVNNIPPQHDDEEERGPVALVPPHPVLKGRSKSAFIRSSSNPEVLSKEDARKRMLSWRKTTKLRKTTSQQPQGPPANA
eukprot:maker-scaffold369_size193746-snap-gene-0.34 protein:Tk07571 transcript:maker-scaffold369_size193746-snap-gene-0.34-mRNA-1 annotation:"membrane protein"